MKLCVYVVIRWTDVRAYSEGVRGVFEKLDDAVLFVIKSANENCTRIASVMTVPSSNVVASWEFLNDGQNGWSIEKWELQ